MTKAEQDAHALMERVVVMGDLSGLSAQERMQYYLAYCRSVGLNPITRPLEFLTLDDKLVLYARKECTDQLRDLHGVEITSLEATTLDGVYVVTAKAKRANGRTDSDVGAVPIVKERGEWKTAQNGKRYFQGDGTYIPLTPSERANAIMKASTKAKRRVTLSICGLGVIDESEIETIAGAVPVELPAMGSLPPDAEVRASMILDIQRLSAARKLSPDEKRDIARKHLGEWKIEEAPLAMVEALTNDLRAQNGEVAWGKEAA